MLHTLVLEIACTGLAPGLAPGLAKVGLLGFDPPMSDRPSTPPVSGPEKGAGLILQLARNLSEGPGVYRMIGRIAASGDGEADTEPQVLYVGKAKNLKKRVLSYTQPGRLSPRIQRMVAATEEMEFVTTHTESEALLLEANLIKQLSPRYNILLRDDKSFPEILVESGHAFPRILKHRGARKAKGTYFGPFASVWAVNETLAFLQRAFLLRTCSDSVFEGRTRPCLLYQIKRCAGPCVGRISEPEYAALVDQSSAFLGGKSQQLQKQLASQMQDASDAKAFEAAALLRDRIRALTRIQSHQDINPGTVVEADVVALFMDGEGGRGRASVQVFFIRGGRNFGNRAYYPTQAAGETPEVVLEAFLGQFYANHPPPREVLVSHRPSESALLTEILTQRAGRKVRLSQPTRGDRAGLVRHALENAKSALVRKRAEAQAQEKMLEGLSEALGLETTPERIEVYDNSHISGTKAVGAMIVAGPEGFRKNAYRKFNIKSDIAPGDDYAMMREVLSRRFTRALKAAAKEGHQPGDWPDLVLIDGGKGQLGVVEAVFAELGITDVALAAISKGPDRNAGREQIHQPGASAPLVLDHRDPVLYFLQRIRDEAHRFAIGSHRARRKGAIRRSSLDDIPGIGAKRKKALLHHFGSASAVEDAGLSDLATVDGISSRTAQRIYDWFHNAS